MTLGIWRCITVGGFQTAFLVVLLQKEQLGWHPAFKYDKNDLLVFLGLICFEEVVCDIPKWLFFCR